MKKASTFTYVVGDGIYINLTNKCSNRCEFCIRQNADGAYGSDSLWLEREPTVEEVLADLDRRDMAKFSEAVFCGYGEPTYRLDDMLKIAKEIKRRYGMKTRLNTNGHSSAIHGFDTSPAFEGALDSISISLNAPNADRYNEICHPVYKNSAYFSLIDFAKKCKEICAKRVLFRRERFSFGGRG